LVAAGLDGVALFREADDVEALFLIALAERVHAIKADERQDLAVRIINTLSKAMPKRSG
jgi:hypothetical protein